MSLVAKPRPKAYHKKRQAEHHRHSQHYLRTYWPYLPMLVIVGLGFMINSLLVSSAEVLGVSSNFSSSSLLSLTNQARTADHEASLSLNSQLMAAAQTKANTMAKQNYWSHTSPSGQTALNLITASGYQFSQAGENLAYGFNSASQVMSAWLASPDHRANILNSGYQVVGFGVAESANFLGEGPKVIVAAEYAQPAGSSVAPIPVVNQPNAVTVSRLEVLTGSNASWTEIGLTAVITAALVFLVVRHSLHFRKLVQRGEYFVIEHPLIDIIVALLATAAVLLIHTVGLIS